MDSLSKKLNLRVNGYHIVLGQELSKSELIAHKFKKAGFFARLQIKPQRNELVFWSKNCELKYLKEEFDNVIFPILDNKAGAAIMYGTSEDERDVRKKVNKSQNKKVVYFFTDVPQPLTIAWRSRSGNRSEHGSLSGSCMPLGV